jgi:hypothetical protein
MENDQNNRAERILNSLGGLQKAQAPDFFYTRLIGKMQGETELVRRPFVLLRPAFVTAALLLVFIMNIVSLVQLDKKPAAQPSSSPANIESFAKAYNLETGSVYE